MLLPTRRLTGMADQPLHNAHKLVWPIDDKGTQLTLATQPLN